MTDNYKATSGIDLTDNCEWEKRVVGRADLLAFG